MLFFFQSLKNEIVDVATSANAAAYTKLGVQNFSPVVMLPYKRTMSKRGQNVYKIVKGKSPPCAKLFCINRTFAHE